MKKETFQYSSLKERIKTEYRVYIIAFIFILIADSIGQIKIPLGPGMLILFPIFYSLFMGILSGPQILKVMKEKEVTAASKLVIVAICPFIAKLGINAGASLSTVIQAGPALLLQEIGNLGTIFLALPFALLLGLKREAIGATHSINRETNLALITGSPRQLIHLHSRRHDRNHLFRIYGYHGSCFKYFPPIRTGNGLRRRRRHHDGVSHGQLNRDLPGYGR